MSTSKKVELKVDPHNLAQSHIDRFPNLEEEQEEIVGEEDDCITNRCEHRVIKPPLDT